MVRSRGGHVDAALGRSPAPPHLWNSMSLLEVDLSAGGTIGGPGPRPVRRPGDPVVAGPFDHVSLAPRLTASVPVGFVFKASGYPGSSEEFAGSWRHARV